MYGHPSHLNPYGYRAPRWSRTRRALRWVAFGALLGAASIPWWVGMFELASRLL